MPYCLTQDESILRGMRRIVREEVQSAVEQLRTKDASKRDEAIHETRKSIKKLRGVVRLLMPELGEAGREDNSRLRDIGRTLSEFRDAAALIEIIDTLGEKHTDDPGAAPALHSVRAELVRRRNAAARQQDGAEIAHEAISALRGLGRRANSWRLGSDGFDSIAYGLEITYRRGRKALNRAQKKPTAVNYHDFRKRVKDHWYHVRLLENFWADSTCRRARRASRICRSGWEMTTTWSFCGNGSPPSQIRSEMPKQSLWSTI